MTDEDHSIQGQEVPPPVGLPAGWKCFKKQYLTGPMAGKPYYRFSGGPEFKHKGVVSVRAAVKKDAEDRGLDVDEEIANYDRAKQERAEASVKAKEEAGRLSGERREESVNLFRQKAGMLDGPIIQAFPGWKCEFVYKASNNCTVVTFVDPEGARHGSVKDVESYLGCRMRDNESEIIALVKEARSKASPANFARASQSARFSFASQGTRSIASLFSKGGGGGAAKAAGDPKDAGEEKAEQPGLPSTPPKRSSRKDCGGSAEKSTTTAALGSAPCAVAAAAAVRELGAGGCGAAAVKPPGGGLGDMSSPISCPACSRRLEYTDYADGGYVGCEGWQCDNHHRCGMDSNVTGSWWRWLCRKCESDFCDRCFVDLASQEAKAAKKAAGLSAYFRKGTSADRQASPPAEQSRGAAAACEVKRQGEEEQPAAKRQRKEVVH